MKTIGEILKDARVKKSYSIGFLEEKTKIKKSFIEAIEKQKWGALPAFPTVLGFVKSLSNTLLVDENMAVAVLKRDYPPQKLNINPKPDAVSKFSWSPRLTFVIGIAVVLFFVLGYLGLQYFEFISPPSLKVDSPKEGQTVTGSTVLVFGTTSADSKVTVNNQPVIVRDDGKFSVSIGITSDTNKIVIKAISRSGKETDISRNIVVR